MVTKRIGQPFPLKGGADDDFGEWTHKVRTFMFARFGNEIFTVLTGATKQQRIFVKTCVASQRNRFVPWIKPPKTRSRTLMTFLKNSMPTLCLLQRRRRHSEYDPTSSTRRVAILQQVQNPPRCHEDLGQALEDWFSKNVNTRCSPSGTDVPARHQTTALWWPCSG